MQRLSIVLALALAGCSSTYDQPQAPPQSHGGYGGGGGYSRASMREAQPTLLDVVPDDTWWRDVALTEPLSLTNDQLTQLDRIASDNRDEILRLERDLPVAQRDFRSSLQMQSPQAADITSAANRVRDIRNSLFDHQVQMLTAERLVLTDQQWSKLLDELQARRQQMQEQNRGNRGGYPGGYGGRHGGGRPWGY